MKRPTLLIYAKPPRMGLAKTRLAQSLGQPALAQRIATMTLARTMRAVAGGPWQVRLYTAPRRALHDSLGGLWPAHLERYPQGHGDLTARLNKGLVEAPMGPVLFIGADAPDLTAAHLSRAIRTLRSKDAVFGPAYDGGFWLFGMHKTSRTKSPFAQVRWSSSNALRDVHANLPHTYKVGMLTRLRDLDEADDWRGWNADRQSLMKHT